MNITAGQVINALPSTKGSWTEYESGYDDALDDVKKAIRLLFEAQESSVTHYNKFETIVLRFIETQTRTWTGEEKSQLQRDVYDMLYR